MCSDHRFGGLETLSSQNNEEREKETNPRLHPEALVAAFRQSGSQSPDSRLVGDWVLSSPCTRGRGRGRWWGCGFPQTGAWLPPDGGVASREGGGVASHSGGRGTGYQATVGARDGPLYLPFFLNG